MSATEQPLPEGNSPSTARKQVIDIWGERLFKNYHPPVETIGGVTTRKVVGPPLELQTGLEPKAELSTPMLMEAVQEQCRACIRARILGGSVVELAEKIEAEPILISEAFSNFVNYCKTGAYLIGVCGTEKTECGHTEMPKADNVLMKAKARELIQSLGPPSV